MTAVVRAVLARLVIGLVRAYQVGISPLLPPRCRFTPSCSAYAVEAVEVHGAGRGSWLAVRRLARCHPLCRGGWDPVPERHAAGSDVPCGSTGGRQPAGVPTPRVDLQQGPASSAPLVRGARSC